MPCRCCIHLGARHAYGTDLGIGRDHGCAQAKLRPIGQLDGLLLGGEGGRCQHRPEHLLPPDLHVGLDACEHGRLHEEAPGQVPRHATARQQLGALLPGPLHGQQCCSSPPGPAASWQGQGAGPALPARQCAAAGPLGVRCTPPTTARWQCNTAVNSKAGLCSAEHGTAMALSATPCTAEGPTCHHPIHAQRERCSSMAGRATGCSHHGHTQSSTGRLGPRKQHPPRCTPAPSCAETLTPLGPSCKTLPGDCKY